LFFSSGKDRRVARFVDAYVKLIGVEKFAFLLSRVRKISSLENRGKRSDGTTRDGDIDA